jgi:hypothetical protein
MLLRRLPPMPPSVVAEPISSWSAAIRRMKSACQTLSAPCSTRLDSLMWCIAKDHGAGSAGLAEHRAEFGDLGRGGALATETARDLDAEQALGLHRIHGLPRKPAFKIDGVRMYFAAMATTRAALAAKLSSVILTGKFIRRPSGLSWIMIDGLGDGRDAGEGFAVEQVVGKLDVEGILDAEHQLDRGEGGEPDRVEISIVGHLVDSHWQLAELGQQSTDCRIHPHISKLVITRAGVHRPVLKTLLRRKTQNSAKTLG